MSTCDRDHTDVSSAAMESVPESQGKRWRHRCAACAYELGLAHGARTEGRLRERVRELSAKVDALEAAAITARA
jgi:hypothetical protein